jgi:predicted dinucleotide-utilizing enzyme
MGMQTIAIVGLGAVGTGFLEELLGQSNPHVEIVAVVEGGETTGRPLADKHGIKILSIDELILMGDKLDILFELSNLPSIRQELKDKLQASGNRHTIIATENIARMILTLISRGADLPRR